MLDSKIQKATQELVPVSFHKKGRKINDILEVDEFNKDAKAGYQSILDLIVRKQKIKTAIVISNSVTTLEVGGKSMTVADAINYKKLVDYKKVLVQTLRTKTREQQAIFNRNNESVRDNAIRLATAYYQSGNASAGNVEAAKQLKKAIENDTDKVQDNYIANNEFHWLDPLNIESAMKKMEEEYSEFEAEVDAALSTSNAITVIEIE